MKRIINVSLLAITCLSIIFCSIAFADSSDSNSDDQGSGEILVSSEVGSLRIAASDTSGLHSILLTLIGDYNPIAVTTTYHYPSGTSYQIREQVDVSPDWSWIMTCALFIVVVYCTFKFIGGLFNK